MSDDPFALQRAWTVGRDEEDEVVLFWVVAARDLTPSRRDRSRRSPIDATFTGRHAITTLVLPRLEIP